MGRFELLAACANKAVTPLPSTKSFSHILIEELGVQERAVQGVTISDLASVLREHRKIQRASRSYCGLYLANKIETPVFHEFTRREGKTGISLKCLSDTSSLRFAQKPAAHIMFRASLSSDVTAFAIAEWLKNAPPINVTSVRIEAAVLDARHLQSIIEQDHTPSNLFSQGSIFDKLSPAAKDEIIRAFQTLNTTLDTSKRLAEEQPNQKDSEEIRKTLQSIEEATTAVRTAVETPLLTQLQHEDLVTASEDLLVDVTGTSASISMYEVCHNITSVDSNVRLSREEIHAPWTQSRFRTGTLKGRTVLIERYRYETDPDTAKPYEETLAQIQRMVALLCHPKGELYHALRCQAFFDEPSHKSFGVSFATPSYFDIEQPVITLHELYERERRVSLGHRIRLASALATALLHFHLVGWVHKGIRSDNVAFLPMKAPQAPDCDFLWT